MTTETNQATLAATYYNNQKQHEEGGQISLVAGDRRKNSCVNNGINVDARHASDERMQKAHSKAPLPRPRS